MASDRLIRHSLPLHAANLVVLAVNALYHRLISSSISPEEYGVLQALNSGIGLLVLPFTAVTAGLTHFMARSVQAGRAGDARALFQRWLLRMAAVGVAVLAVGWLFSPAVAAYFHFHRPEPVVMATLVVAVTVAASAASAPHGATQSFVWVAVFMVVQAAGRLLFGVLLVRLVFPTAGWALLGTALAIGVSVSLALGSLRRVLPPSAGPGDGRAPVVAYVAWSIPFLLAYTALFSADAMVVKRLFQPQEAGFYAQIANLARLAVFLPLPFCRVLFPKVASGGAVSDAQRVTWLKAVGVTLLLMAGVAGVTLAFPRPIAGLIFPMLVLDERWMGILVLLLAATVANGLTHILLYFETAQHRFATLTPILVATLAYLGGVRGFAHDLAAATGFFAVCNLAAALGCLLLSARRVWRRSTPEPAPAR